MDPKRIELRVPAERNMLLIVRMTTAGVMSRVGLTLDEADDVKMAVDEACNMMMLQQPLCRELALSYDYDEKSVTVLVEGIGESEGDCEKKADVDMQEVIRCILASMVDEVEMTEREDGSTQAIRLAKNVPEQRRVSA